MTDSQLEAAVRAHGQSGRDAEKGKRRKKEERALNALGQEIEEDAGRDVRFRPGTVEAAGA